MKPVVSLLLSAWNEELILEAHLVQIENYLRSLEGEYTFEIIVIDDGSCDNTGKIAKKFCQREEKRIFIQHQTNEGLGKSLRDGFAISTGDYVLTLDVDLTSPLETIQILLESAKKTHADIVIASPTAASGKYVSVPLVRQILSKCANRYLSFFSPKPLTNFTCMYRVYRGDFIRSLPLTSMGMDLMPEIIRKALIFQGKILEVPSKIDWSRFGKERRSSMNLFPHTKATLLAGFKMSPFLFFMIPGLCVFCLSLYPMIWACIHFFTEFHTQSGSLFESASRAIEQAFMQHPHTFVIGFFSLILGIQLLAVGMHSLQTRYYYEDLLRSLGRKE